MCESLRIAIMWSKLSRRFLIGGWPREETFEVDYLCRQCDDSYSKKCQISLLRTEWKEYLVCPIHRTWHFFTSPFLIMLKDCSKEIEFEKFWRAFGENWSHSEFLREVNLSIDFRHWMKRLRWYIKTDDEFISWIA